MYSVGRKLYPVLPHMDDDITGPHLSSNAGVEALVFVPRPDSRNGIPNCSGFFFL